MVSPLACQVGSCLVWACCFSRLLLFGLVPSPPCGVGPVVFLVGPAPPVEGAVCSTEVWYGCCHLLVAMSSLRALSPPPPVGWGLWSFWLAPPSLCGAVCSTEIWYGCCYLLVVMSSLRARYHTKYDVALFSLQTVRPVPALMRFSAPVKKHWLGSFVLPRSGLRGFVPVVRDRREQGPPAAGGRGQGRGGGGIPWGGGGVWGPGTREHVCLCVYGCMDWMNACMHGWMDGCMCVCMHDVCVSA